MVTGIICERSLSTNSTENCTKEKDKIRNSGSAGIVIVYINLSLFILSSLKLLLLWMKLGGKRVNNVNPKCVFILKLEDIARFVSCGKNSQ